MRDRSYVIVVRMESLSFVGGRIFSYKSPECFNVLKRYVYPRLGVVTPKAIITLSEAHLNNIKSMNPKFLDFHGI